MKRCLTLITVLCVILSMSAMTYQPAGIKVVSYDNETDYLSEMYKAAEDGSEYALKLGAIYEQQRNLKIKSIASEYEPTFFFSEKYEAQEIKDAIKKYASKIVLDESEVELIAEVVFAEARGIKSLTQQACVVWCVLNRVDASHETVHSVVNAPNQFASVDGAFTDDYGRDIRELVRDVMTRWHMEKAGETEVGRVLPSTYTYYGGNGKENFFRDSYMDFSNLWDYSLPSPYSN